MNIKNLKAKGFTLIELLVTIAILGILVYVATPYYSKILQEKDLSTAKNRIIHSLQKAKRIASAENTFVDVNINNDLIQLTPQNSAKTLTIKIPNRISAESVTKFTFNANGKLLDENDQNIEEILNIKINPKTNSSLYETITVSKTGVIASL